MSPMSDGPAPAANRGRTRLLAIVALVVAIGVGRSAHRPVAPTRVAPPLLLDMTAGPALSVRVQLPLPSWY